MQTARQIESEDGRIYNALQVLCQFIIVNGI